jgi:hypothetical protein
MGFGLIDESQRRKKKMGPRETGRKQKDQKKQKYKKKMVGSDGSKQNEGKTYVTHI